MWESR